MEELKKKDKNKKKLRQIEDYDDEVCDENISVQKSEQLQHISNDCKQNNLKILSQKASYSQYEKSPINSNYNTEYNTHYLRPKKGNNNLKHNQEYFDAWKEAQEKNEKL